MKILDTLARMARHFALAGVLLAIAGCGSSGGDGTDVIGGGDGGELALGSDVVARECVVEVGAERLDVDRGQESLVLAVGPLLREWRGFSVEVRRRDVGELVDGQREGERAQERRVGDQPDLVAWRQTCVWERCGGGAV